MTNTQIRNLVIGVISFFVLIIIWFVFIPPYNIPKFENIENNQTGFLIPLDHETEAQVHFESAAYLKDKKVAAKRVQIHRRWIQKGWIYNFGEYIDVERLIVVDRLPVIREWTDNLTKDSSLSAQSKDGTGLKLNFTCTAFIPESNQENPEGAEHFLYYYKGESLSHVMDNEVRARVQSVAAEFCAQYTLETLRGTQHKLAEAVRDDVIAFFKKRGITVTNIGLVGGFHYVNKDIQKSIDDAIKAQQLKVAALAMQEKEKVEQQTKLQNQEIDNKTMKMEAEGRAAAKLAAATVDAESAKIRATGEANAMKILTDADAYKYEQLSKYKELVLSLKALDVEMSWRTKWLGTVPNAVFQGMGNSLPVFPLNLDKEKGK